MRYLCEDVGVASCSSHTLCSYNLTLGSIPSVYPDRVNDQDILLIVSSSSFRPIPSSFVTPLHSGMILDNKVPTPSQYVPCMWLVRTDSYLCVVTLFPIAIPRHLLHTHHVRLSLAPANQMQPKAQVTDSNKV
jgi:hypothetical protein